MEYVSMARKFIVENGVELPDCVITGFANGYAPIGAVLDQVEFAAREAAAGTSVAELWGQFDAYLTANKCPAHTDRLPLMNPFHSICLVLCYLITIGFLYSFGNYLPNVREFRLFKLTQILHNLFLVLVSGFMTYECLRQALILDFGIFSNTVDLSPRGWPMAKIIWLFYVSKWYEYLDTVFMCLRKNWVQVSFLHVYHHFATFLIWWGVSFLAPGGEGYYAVVLNTFVHVIMYSYYFYTTMGWKFPLKFYITYIQMAQFALNILHAGYGIWFAVPGFPNVLRWVSFLYMFTLLFLFWNFMRQAKKRIRAQKALDAKKKK